MPRQSSFRPSFSFTLVIFTHPPDVAKVCPPPPPSPSLSLFRFLLLCRFTFGLFDLFFFFSFFRDSEIRGIRILFLGIDAHTHRSLETIEKSGCELLKLNHVRIHLYRSFFRGTSNVGIEIETVRTIAEIQRKEGGRRT